MNKNKDMKMTIFKKALAAGILAGAGVALSFVSIPVGPTLSPVFCLDRSGLWEQPSLLA
jgi:hypothetical protein